MSDDVKKVLEKLFDNMDFIKTEDIPDIDLYMDQVTTFMDSHLKSLKRFDEDKILTKTMINNYAKNNLFPSPDKKRYSKDHLLILTFIYYLKSFLSIQDIKKLLGPITDNYFHAEGGIDLEDVYKEVCDMESFILKSVKKDVEEKIQIAGNSFLTADDDYLRKFMLICLLSFDVYIKKQMVESLIDSIKESVSKDEKVKKNK